jgi:predicted phosphoadenosine phosphosulfate sulfurtransferase
MVASKKNDSFITARAENKNSYRAFPIYDWDSSDVWKLVNKFNLDYNHTYDLLNKTVMHNKFLRQRVCPPFGEEPLRGLWIYAECFPDLWDKMINRVPGVATAWRYANTELYSNHAKPDNLTWKEYFHLLLENYEPEYKALIIKNVNGLIKRHYNCTDDDIKDDEPHPISGAHWKFFAKIAQKGDFKGRQNQVMQNEKEPVLKKLGITYEEALKQFGKRSK